MRLFLLIAAVVPLRAQVQTPGCCAFAVPAIAAVRESAFPELAKAEITVRGFPSNSDFLRATFDYTRYFLGGGCAMKSW